LIPIGGYLCGMVGHHLVHGGINNLRPSVRSSVQAILFDGLVAGYRDALFIAASWFSASSGSSLAQAVKLAMCEASIDAGILQRHRSPSRRTAGHISSRSGVRPPRALRPAKAPTVRRWG